MAKGFASRGAEVSCHQRRRVDDADGNVSLTETVAALGDSYYNSVLISIADHGRAPLPLSDDEQAAFYGRTSHGA